MSEESLRTGDERNAELVISIGSAVEMARRLGPRGASGFFVEGIFLNAMRSGCVRHGPLSKDLTEWRCEPSWWRDAFLKNNQVVHRHPIGVCHESQLTFRPSAEVRTLNTGICADDLMTWLQQHFDRGIGSHLNDGDVFDRFSQTLQGEAQVGRACVDALTIRTVPREVRLHVDADVRGKSSALDGQLEIDAIEAASGCRLAPGDDERAEIAVAQTYLRKLDILEERNRIRAAKGEPLEHKGLGKDEVVKEAREEAGGLVPARRAWDKIVGSPGCGKPKDEERQRMIEERRQRFLAVINQKAA